VKVRKAILDATMREKAKNEERTKAKEKKTPPAKKTRN
jgi:hypothetical protein